MLRGCGLTPIVVVHANHANELDANVARALARMSDAGIVMLNQAVLLAGVNDSLEAQLALCERLIDLRVLPYYLHQLDPVAGAAHFEVPIERGRQIIEQLRARLPGYAVPRYVQEVPGESSKSELI
jgi:L-lysine 2,3-aminomutase